jgi:hypothetical protein
MLSISNLLPAAKQLHGRSLEKSGENVKEYLLVGGVELNLGHSKYFFYFFSAKNVALQKAIE